MGTVNRRFRAVVPASLAAALFALSACGSDDPESTASASPTPAAAETAPGQPSPTAAPTTNSPDLEAIEVEGAPGETPTVSVPAPWGVAETQTKVLVPGDGATVDENATVNVHYIGVNGRTGQPFDESYSRGQAVPFPLNQVVPGFQKGLAGQKVGSRVLIAMPGTDGYDSAGGNPQADIQVGDTLIFVADIVSLQPEEAEGEPVAPRPGLPTVEFADGEPQITIPADTPPPNELVVQPLIRGAGEPVAETDRITVHYQSVTWSNGAVVDNTYAQQPQQGALSELIPAWREALTDQPVGSRLLIVSPPDQAYPVDPGARTPNPLQGETVVFVVDILAAAPGM